MEGIPKLIDARIPNLRPGINSALKLQLILAREAKSEMVLVELPVINQKQVDHTLSKLRNLPILTI